MSQVISALDSYSHTPFVRIGDEIVFSGRMGSTVGTELFAYNTADDSTYLLKDYVPGFNSGEPRELSESEGVVYFSVVFTGQSMVGTYDGINFINYDANPEPNSGSNPYNFYAGSKGVFFTQYDGPGGFGFEVYTSDYYLDTPDGFKENNPDTWLVAYPNPTNGNINISFKNYLEEVTITLKDLHGKVLSSKIFYKTSVINYEIIEPTGIYLLEINSPDGKNTIIKVLKK